MTNPSQYQDDQALHAMMFEMGAKARIASQAIATASNELKSSEIGRAHV